MGFRDLELHDGSLLYKFRHRLRDGGLRGLIDKAYIGFACVLLSGTACLVCFGIWFNASTDMQPAVKVLGPHVIDTKRFQIGPDGRYERK